MRDQRRRRSRSTLRVCITCRWRGQMFMDDEEIRPGQRLFDLTRRMAPGELQDRVQGIVCLSHCMNACNAVLTQRGKPAQLMTRMEPTEACARELLNMFEQFDQSATGNVSSTTIENRPLVPGRKAEPDS